MSAPLLPADGAGIARAAGLVEVGGIIVYPTETVYGLGVDPFNGEALERVFAVKGRGADRALILLIRGVEDLHGLAADVPGIARTLISAFWPGPLTLVLPARPGLPERLLGPGGTLALRQSGAPVAQRLLRRLGGPITSTSANRSGEPPARSAQQAAASLGADVDLILDGGPSPDARPSTLVRIASGKLEILREGSLSAETLHRFLKEKK